jgi:predicted P-loop ATPase
VIELSELSGLGSREIEHIKAFISRREERWIPKFMEFATVYKRHCIFFGTTNSDEFLADETGNRRFLPVRLGPKQDVQAIIRDKEQLWAECLWRWKREGVLWQDVARLVTQEHAQFMVHDPWEDTVGRWMGETPVGSSVRNGDRPFIQTDEIMRDALHLEARSVKGSDGHRLGRVMRALNCEHVQKRVGGTVLKGWRKK